MNAPMTSPLTVAEAIAERLGHRGVSAVYGLMGDDTAKLAAYLPAAGVEFSCARHENSAVAMALGHGWAADEPGVVLLSRGPGLTNGFTGIVDASRGSQGVLVLTGDRALAEVPRGFGPDHKALDLEAVAAAASVRLVKPREPGHALNLLDQALAAVGAGETVIYAVPRDVLEQPLVVAKPLPLAHTSIRNPPRASAVAAAAALVAESRRPVILAGRGSWVSDAREALIDLAEHTGALLGTTLLAQGMFASHPYDIGIVGSFSHTMARRLLEEADLVIAVGASLNRYTTANRTALPDVPVIHVDSVAEHVGRYYHADVAVIGDARLSVEAIRAAVPAHGLESKPFHSEKVRRQLAEFSLDDEFDDESTAQTIDPRVLVRTLNALLPDNRAVVTDVGNAFGFVSPLLRVPSPDRYRVSTDFAAIGLGLATGIGAALGRRNCTTVAFVGDGAFLMVLGELETLARLDVPVVVVCMNDHAYGAEKHYLDLQGVHSGQTIFPDTDFAALAAEFGLDSHSIRSVADLEAVSEELGRVTGPVVLDCKITPTILAPFLTTH